MEEEPRLFTDVRNAVDNDEYMWIVDWGPPRSSKTTLAGWICYSIYKDWDKVLNAFVFNLSQLLYKMKHGLPERWPTRNLLHNRVPVLNWDDFGAHSNKAATQHNLAWDLFKGGFDVLGTKIGVLIATMVDPLEPTFQIQSKYTHEIQILGKGKYKYDKVYWQQDYKGWKPRHSKDWIETNEFDPWPMEVYKRYDEMRMSLADEVILKIEDAITESEADRILKLIQPEDIQILDFILERGPIEYHNIQGRFGKSMKKSIVRLKARCLITPILIKGKYYRYDITDLGHDVYKLYQQQSELKKKEFAKLAIYGT